MPMMEDILKNYDIKPIIIIHNKDQLESLKKELEAKRFKFLIGIEETNLREIRTWDDGILLLPSE